MPRGIDRSGDASNDLTREGVIGRIVNRFTDPETRAPEVYKGQNAAYRKRARIYGGSDEQARRRTSALRPDEGLQIWTGEEHVENTPENRKKYPFGRSNEAWAMGSPRLAGDRTVRRIR